MAVGLRRVCRTCGFEHKTPRNGAGIDRREVGILDGVVHQNERPRAGNRRASQGTVVRSDKFEELVAVPTRRLADESSFGHGPRHCRDHAELDRMAAGSVHAT